MARNIIRNQNVLDTKVVRRQPKPHHRTIAKFTLDVWPGGISHGHLADELGRIAGLLREGYQSGDVNSEELTGWWDTKEPE